MLPLLLCCAFAQDAPDPPATNEPSVAPAPPAVGGPRPGSVAIEWNGPDGPVSIVAPRSDGTFPPAFVPTAPGGLRLMGERIVLHNLVPSRSVGPFSGTLKLTAPDGTVTEYRVEFAPDPPPAAEPSAKFRLGVALDSMEPTGDPPGLPVHLALEGSPAAKAGLKGGDRIISAGGEPLTSYQRLRDAVVGAAEGGESLAVKVVRPGGDGKEDRLLEFQITPETIDLTAEPWKPIPIETGRLDSGEPFRFSVGPATVRPAESGEIAAERAEVRIQEAREQLELAEGEEARAVQLAGSGIVSDREVAQARAKAATARVAVRLAELDRRAAGERIEADRRRRAAGAAAAEARLRATRAKLKAVEAEVGATKEDVERLETQVENGERPEIDLLAARNRLTAARMQAEAVRAEIEVAQTAGRAAAENFERAARQSDRMPGHDALQKEVAELRALVERLRSEGGER